MDWKECCDKKIVKDVSIDFELIESLMQTSSKKLESASRLSIDDVTAASVISLCYDSLRELLEAIAAKRCFKIYNHECYTSFLKEILKEEVLCEKFDKIRKIRNGINYYGKDVSIEDALEIKSEIMFVIDRLKELLV